MSQEQLEVMEELEREIECCTDPDEKAEYERTLTVCREVSYALAEGRVTAEEIGGEVFFTAA